jgi:hypothetical protein
MPIFIILPLLETALAVAVSTLVVRTVSDLYGKFKN